MTELQNAADAALVRFQEAYDQAVAAKSAYLAKHGWLGRVDPEFQELERRYDRALSRLCAAQEFRSDLLFPGVRKR